MPLKSKEPGEKKNAKKKKEQIKNKIDANVYKGDVGNVDMGWEQIEGATC